MRPAGSQNRCGATAGSTWRPSPPRPATATRRTCAASSPAWPVRGRAAGWAKSSETFKTAATRSHQTATMTGSNPTVWLTLQAHDAPKLIDYYVQTFGFVLAARYGEGRRIAYAQLNWPEGSGGIMLGSHKPGAEWCREPGTSGGY